MTIDTATKAKIDAIHEAVIRLEPTVNDVKDIKLWKDGTPGNALPGAQTQVWVLWVCFLGLISFMLAK